MTLPSAAKRAPVAAASGSGVYLPLPIASVPNDPTLAAHRLDEPIRQRTLVARELIHAGAQVRTQLPSRIRGIADFSELVEGMTVIIEERR